MAWMQVAHDLVLNLEHVTKIEHTGTHTIFTTTEFFQEEGGNGEQWYYKASDPEGQLFDEVRSRVLGSQR